MRSTPAAPRNAKLRTTDTMEEHGSSTEAEQDADQVDRASAHELALRSAADLNRRLQAFETRMLEQFEQLARELDGGQGTICAEAAEIERQLALCKAAQESGGGGATSSADHDRELADLRQRYEMAVSDIRDLKKQLADQERSGAAAAKNGRASAAPTGPLDWEAQKRQLLASLEDEAAEDPEPDEARAGERLQIEQVIRTTDAALRNKQVEIDELREQLASAAGNAARSAERTATNDAQLESSEVIQEELKRLRALEATLQTNLRQAEIELSVERAHLARFAAELEEKQRGLAEHQGDHATTNHIDPSGKPKKPQRKWLARLGLNEEGK
jgi:chromosome segregation ATPase